MMSPDRDDVFYDPPYEVAELSASVYMSRDPKQVYEAGQPSSQPSPSKPIQRPILIGNHNGD